jgi:hypothetical protein
MNVLLLQRLIEEHDASLGMSHSEGKFHARICVYDHHGITKSYHGWALDLETAIAKALEKAKIPAFW